MIEQSIVVEHIERSDWALVLIAVRTSYGRRYLTTMIFVNDGCGLFATCPHAKAWARTAQIVVFEPPEARREEMLKNAVADFVREVGLRSNILDRSRVGVIAKTKAKAARFDDAPPGFSLSQDTEPAYAWLFERSETAVDAMRVLRFLIEKYNLGKLTQAEREEIGERSVRKGY